MVDAVHEADYDPDGHGKDAEYCDDNLGAFHVHDGNAEPGMTDAQVTINSDRNHDECRERNVGRDEELVHLCARNTTL